MNRHVAGYVREQRLLRGLTLVGLARLVAPDNIRKSAARIGRFESEGVIGEDLFVAVAEALGIDYPAVEELMDQDRQESFIRGDPVHSAEPRTWTPERANPTPPPSKTPASSLVVEIGAICRCLNTER